MALYEYLSEEQTKPILVKTNEEQVSFHRAFSAKTINLPPPTGVIYYYKSMFQKTTAFLCNDMSVTIFISKKQVDLPNLDLLCLQAKIRSYLMLQKSANPNKDLS